MGSILVSDATEIADGIWFPPHSSRTVPARLVNTQGSLVVLSREEGEETTRLVWGLRSDIEISPRVGTVPRRLMFGNESVFETRDNDGIDAFLSRYSERRIGFVHRLETSRARLAAFAIAAVFFALTIYHYALPVMVEVAVWVTPPVVPRMMGEGTLKTLDGLVLKPSRLPIARQDQIEQSFAKISALAEGGSGHYKLNFRDGGPIGANAFALPDGNLVLTDQLVDLAGDDTEMITAVLAHEIGHVEYKHSLRQLYRVAGIGGLVMLIGGDVGSGVEDAITQGGSLLALSYSRSAESQADRRSVELMRKAGMDPTAIARFFKLLEDRLHDTSGTSMLSTHPGTPERSREILDYANQLQRSKPTP
jgi:Zn-dependent protease with chaperone function